MTATKQWYESKTFWFNGVTLLIGLATFLQGQEVAAAIAPWLVTVITVGNLILRTFFTSKPIA